MKQETGFIIKVTALNLSGFRHLTSCFLNSALSNLKAGDSSEGNDFSDFAFC
jgi:hypothetical protein